MNYYYDTEFLEGTQKTFFGKTKPTIDLISIGIVAEDGREYYAISKDFNLKEAWNRYDLKPDIENGGMKKVYWIRENVLKPIFYELMGKDINFHNIDGLFSYQKLKSLIKKYGKTNSQIAKEAQQFVFENEIDIDQVNLYGYYSAYDHVALCWLFGKMIDLPKGFPMYTRDLKHILDDKAMNSKITVRSKDDGFSERKCFIGDFYKTKFNDMVNYIKDHKNYPAPYNEHNALADAQWNKALHEFIKSI